MRLVNMQGSTLWEGNRKKKKWYLFLLHQFYKVLQVPGAVQPHGFDGALGLELYHTVLETTSSVLSEQHSDKL